MSQLFFRNPLQIFVNYDKIENEISAPLCVLSDFCERSWHFSCFRQHISSKSSLPADMMHQASNRPQYCPAAGYQLIKEYRHMAKIRVAVLFGGVSSEHEVSCVSASAWLRALGQSPCAEQYEAFPVGITKDGRWLACHPTPEAMAGASVTDVADTIKSLGFYKSKAKHAVEAAQMIVADYGGEVPADMKELVKLPGVGRKTANIVLNVGYGIVEGIAVDTHVNRIAHRLMLSPKTHAKEPLKTEQDLLKILPHEYWESVNHQWITFGREICDARKPKCDECPLADLCPSVRVAG